jgi:hypothetical protein
MRFFDAEERSGFSTRAALKFRHKTILRHDVFLPPMPTQTIARILN